MKKTVLYSEIDGYKIITGFDIPVIDPVETAKIVNKEIQNTSEWQAVEGKKKEYADALGSLRTAASSRDNKAYQGAVNAMEAIQKELHPLVLALNDKIKALRSAHAVYFEPRKGEAIVDAETADGLLKSIKGRAEGVFITLDGATVEDNRGKVYFRKVSGRWTRTRITKLGDKIPNGAVMGPDLTDAQRDEAERDRITTLAPATAAREKETLEKQAMKDSMTMRAELEIQGDTEALKKSQDRYKAEMGRIKSLYG